MSNKKDISDLDNFTGCFYDSMSVFFKKYLAQKIKPIFSKLNSNPENIFHFIKYIENYASDENVLEEYVSNERVSEKYASDEYSDSDSDLDNSHNNYKLSAKKKTKNKQNEPKFKKEKSKKQNKLNKKIKYNKIKKNKNNFKSESGHKKGYESDSNSSSESYDSTDFHLYSNMNTIKKHFKNLKKFSRGHLKKSKLLNYNFDLLTKEQKNNIIWSCANFNKQKNILPYNLDLNEDTTIDPNATMYDNFQSINEDFDFLNYKQEKKGIEILSLADTDPNYSQICKWKNDIEKEMKEDRENINKDNLQYDQNHDINNNNNNQQFADITKRYYLQNIYIPQKKNNYDDSDDSDNSDNSNDSDKLSNSSKQNDSFGMYYFQQPIMNNNNNDIYNREIMYRQYHNNKNNQAANNLQEMNLENVEFENRDLQEMNLENENLYFSKLKQNNLTDIDMEINEFIKKHGVQLY